MSRLFLKFREWTAIVFVAIGCGFVAIGAAISGQRGFESSLDEEAPSVSTRSACSPPPPLRKGGEL